MKTQIALSLITLFFLMGCSSPQKEPKQVEKETKPKAEPTENTLFTVAATIETEPAKAVGNDDDAADDPALWIHPNNPSKSLVFGSNKKAGIEVYSLKGARLNFYPVGLINNIDVLQGLIITDDTLSILGGSNRTGNTLDIYRIYGADSLPLLTSISPKTIQEVYGFCFYQSQKTGKNYAIVNGKSGAIEQFEIIWKKGTLSLQLVRELKAPSQVEGMVADPSLNRLYVGVEEAGIMVFSAEPEGGDQHTWIADANTQNPNIAYDIEGLALYEKGGRKYLVASSQGNNTFAVFDCTEMNKYIGSFQVIMDSDSIQDTDGIEVTSAALGEEFPKGIFVCQDGYNKDGKGNPIPQNFKLVDWREIEKGLQ